MLSNIMCIVYSTQKPTEHTYNDGKKIFTSLWAENSLKSRWKSREINVEGSKQMFVLSLFLFSLFRSFLFYQRKSLLKSNTVIAVTRYNNITMPLFVFVRLWKQESVAAFFAFLFFSLAFIHISIWYKLNDGEQQIVLC